MDKRKVLFMCVHNSARSQMAEAFLNHYGKNDFVAESAGLTKGTLNPMVLQVMNEEGYDLSNNSVDSVFDFFKEGRLYHYVITVCDAANSERCPIFPGKVINYQWSFEDPSGVTGTDEEKLQKIRDIRDQIHQRILRFVEEAS